MPLSEKQKLIVKTVCIIDAIQATIWFILSLLCVIYYYQGAQIDEHSNSFISNFYRRFLDQKASYPDNILPPKTFTSFNWVYIFLNLCWLFLSLNLLHDVTKEAQKLSSSFTTIGICLLLISLLDIILDISIAMDCNKTPKIAESCFIGTILIVAKFFIFCIFNILSGYLLIIWGRRLKREEFYHTCQESPGNNAQTMDYNNETIDYNIETTSNSLPEYEYRFEYRDEYCTERQSHYNWQTGQMEWQSVMVIRPKYEYRYVQKDRY